MAVKTIKADSDIKRDVLRELKWDPRVSETEVGVQVRDGVVALSGFVTSYAKRLAAVEATHRVGGVLDVANDLEVRIPGVSKKTDTDIAEAARHALMWDVFVPHEKIRTTVSNGWVTLEGDAQYWVQREDAARAVQRLTGVTGVTNNIVVRGQSADPGEIRAAIEEAVERRAEREVERITVQVNDGVVSLRGAVRSWGERHAIEQAAGFAPGVHRVNSDLVIDPYA